METNEAFETLLSQLRQALKDAQKAGSHAFQQRRFDEAQAAAKRGEEIATQFQRLEALQRQWSMFIHGTAPVEPKGGRLPRGQKTPPKEFWLPILMALEEMGGRGKAKDVVLRVGAIMRDQLNETDLKLLSDGRTARWEKTAHFARYDMVTTEGLLSSNSPRGIWEITEKGRAYLREHRAGYSG